MIYKALRLLTLVFIASLSSCAVASEYENAIASLQKEALNYRSDTLFVKRGNEMLLKFQSTENLEPIPAWSITKSFISLGIGFLFDEGAVSLDQPVSDFFPAWKEGGKGLIKIKHLLNHTSGIDSTLKYDVTLDFIKNDNLQIALDQPLLHEPGTTFDYNNHAVNILSVIIEKLSGKRADIFIKERFLDPLGIQDYRWDVDNAGHALGMCGLYIRADDLIKVGEFLLNEGVWNGKRLVSKEWLKLALAPSGCIENKFLRFFSGCGLLFWVREDTPRFYALTGVVGQYCLIFPDQRTIFVRQCDIRKEPLTEQSVQERSFPTLIELARQLISKLPSEH